jgi:hypothetical protein
MKKLIVIVTTSFAVIFIAAQNAEELFASRKTLPNGWSLSPVGRSLPLGDLPLNMASK